MTFDDLDILLAPIDDEAPTGSNLEYEPAFIELEQLATPRSERAVGDNVLAAEEPAWAHVAEHASALLTRSKDLRIAVHLSAAWTRMDGLPGWARGLGVLHGLLENYWSDVHPQLDADDGDDPTARVNALMPVADPQGILGYMRDACFVHSPLLGRFSLRDLRAARQASAGHVVADEASAVPSLVDIEACCQDCDERVLIESQDALRCALEAAGGLDACLRRQLATDSPDLGQLLGDLRELGSFVDAQVARRFPEQAVAQEDEEAADSTGAHASVAPAVRQPVENPEDVLRLLDEICAYYQRHEPSSPVPILLQRARGLVGMNFMDILRSLAPGGLSEMQTISGQDETSY